MSIVGNMVGCYSPMGKTFIIEDANGNEFTAVCVDQEQIFTATDNDVREGFVYAGDTGVSTGTKNIPAYRTTQKMSLIFPGEAFSIKLSQYDQYNYTQLQCIIVRYGEEGDRRAANKIVIGDNVYAVNSSSVLSNVTKNVETKSIDLNITNDTEDMQAVYLFTYREEI